MNSYLRICFFLLHIFLREAIIENNKKINEFLKYFYGEKYSWYYISIIIVNYQE